MSDSIWFTSDLHLNHPMVAEMRGYCCAYHHDLDIAERWRATVTGKRDQVWVLGDVILGGLAEGLEFFAALPGVKHLVAGNHDKCHPMHKGSHSMQRRYLEAFASVQQSATMVIDGTKVHLSHFPYTRDHTPASRHLQWRLPDLGMPLIHGHTHSTSRGDEHEIHVGVDAWDFTPVHRNYIRGML